MSLELKQKIDSFFSMASSSEYEFTRGMQIKNNVTGKMEKVAFGIKRGNIERGITDATYTKHKQYIDDKVNEVVKLREQSKVNNSFVVQALLGNFGVLLNKKLIPFSLFSQLKKENEVYYRTRQDNEEFDDFDAETGWILSQQGRDRIKQYAENIATPEERQAAAKIIAERTERQEKMKVKQEKIQKAKSLASEIKDTSEIFRSADGELYEPVGETIEDPNSPQTIYGGGHWWVVEENRILSIHNNGHDGDDWSVNTIRTGGAGAWAHIIPKRPELVEKLHEIQTLMGESAT